MPKNSLKVLRWSFSKISLSIISNNHLFTYYLFSIFISKKNLGIKLHPSHHLCLNSYLLLSDIYEKIGDMYNSIDSSKKVIEIIQQIVPENYPDLILLRFSLLKRFNSYLTSLDSLSKISKQSLYKEKTNLFKQLENSCLITFGEFNNIASKLLSK